jgi:putative ABC transport system substrate-binding protein
MDRRRFIGTLAGGVLAAPLAAAAQQAGKVYRVALILASTPVSEMAGPEPVNPGTRAFVHALRALGYVEGKNLILERRSLEGRVPASEVAAELVRLKVDVMVSILNAMTHAAKQATTSIPIVMINSTPVEDGLVASLARPGGNVTGLSWDVGPDLDAKRLELLKAAVPHVSRVAFFGSQLAWQLPGAVHVQTTARALGLTLLHAETSANDFAPAFAFITQERPDAIFVAMTTSNAVRRKLIIDFAAKNRVPASYGFGQAVVDGGLMSYGVNGLDLFRRAATYVDKILKGAKPADLPVEQPTNLELVINLKTAKALGLTIPQSVLGRADQVIE